VLSSLRALIAALTFSIATAPYTFHFPRDHFSHDTYRNEWWYFTGHLQAANGRRFGFEVTFFRIGIEPRASQWRRGQSKWYAYQLYPAHFAITDVARERFFFQETLARDALRQGYASQRQLDVRANGWTLRGSDAERPMMQLRADADGSALALTLQPRKPPAINGLGGISRKGPCRSCASHYYSFTRIATSGMLVLDGIRYPVRGTSWMDHEYGSGELMPDQAGWDWFAIQLRDGREVMLYRLREKSGATTPQSSGSLVAAGGSVRYLPLSAFSIRATGSWRSPHTGGVYPSGWIVRVAGIKQELEIVPLVRDQELVGSEGPSYWEGDAAVRDASTGATLGEGYVELTGYAAPLRE
jgi:predicted secreted hydrolase